MASLLDYLPLARAVAWPFRGQVEDAEAEATLALAQAFARRPDAMPAYYRQAMRWHLIALVRRKKREEKVVATQAKKHQPIGAKSKTDSPQLSAHQRGYGARWRRIRRMVLQRDNFTCQAKRAGCLGLATQVDHIQPKDLGGEDKESNLQSLCEYCHVVKTAEEKRSKGRGG
jgi:5-methylcytosine-specific restriction protein A